MSIQFFFSGDVGLDSLPRISSQGFRPGFRRAGAEDSGR
jgi:hypothetical protein